eukprot:1100094-Pyramimonas_sp.AAC.1
MSKGNRPPALQMLPDLRSGASPVKKRNRSPLCVAVTKVCGECALRAGEKPSLNRNCPPSLQMLCNDGCGRR